MAADLRDLRAKITVLAWAFLEAESRTTGTEMSEIVREVLHGWASRKLEGHIVAQKLLIDEGIIGMTRDDKGKP